MSHIRLSFKQARQVAEYLEMLATNGKIDLTAKDLLARLKAGFEFEIGISSVGKIAKDCEIELKTKAKPRKVIQNGAAVSCIERQNKRLADIELKLQAIEERLFQLYPIKLDLPTADGRYQHSKTEHKV